MVGCFLVSGCIGKEHRWRTGSGITGLPERGAIRSAWSSGQARIMNSNGAHAKSGRIWGTTSRGYILPLMCTTLAFTSFLPNRVVGLMKQGRESFVRFLSRLLHVYEVVGVLDARGERPGRPTM